MQENQQDTKRIITPEQVKQGECMDKINTILHSYNMALVPIFKFDGVRLDARVAITERPKLGPDGLPLPPAPTPCKKGGVK